MLKEYLIILLLFINYSILCDIEVFKGQPKISIKVFKSDDLTESIDDFPISNDTKNDVKNFFEFFQESEKFYKANIEIPKIIFMYGNSQNGDKWQLSRLMAKELNYSMIRIFPFELLESGLALNHILRELDEAGPCLIYVDSFDEFLKKSFFDSKFAFQLNNTIEILKKLPIILVCAINDLENLKIKELADPGTIKEILIPFPDLESRISILKYFVKELILDSDVDLKKIAMLTYGFSTNNLLELVNEAKYIALKDSREKINLKDFDLSLSKLQYGKTINVGQNDRKVIAFHEAGHALSKLLLLKEWDPLFKITIASRMSYLGVTCYLQEEKFMVSKQEIESRIQVALAGLVAEKLIFNSAFSGAQSDLQQATNLAKKMVCSFGMSDTLIPMIYNKKDEAAKKEIESIVKKAYENVYKLLNDNKDKLEKIANLLLEKETIYAPELYNLLAIKHE